MAFDSSMMRLRAKQTIKSFLYRHAGAVRAWVPGMEANAMLVASLHHFGIDTVFDVGANIGQFARDLRAGGYDGNIVSFEPLGNAYAALCRAAGKHKNWVVHPRCALGDRSGDTQINVSANSVSSSLLPMLEAHLQAAPTSGYCATENVSLQTLDAIAPSYLSSARAPFLKLDVQGGEWDVLEGARMSLPLIKGVLVELSFVPLYAGQRSAQEITSRLEAEGFRLWRIDPVFNDKATGRLLQANGLFYRY